MGVNQEYPFDTIGFFDASENLLFDGKLDSKGIFILPCNMLNLPNCTVVANTDQPFYAEFPCVKSFEKDEKFTQAIKGKIFSSVQKRCQAYLVINGIKKSCFAIQVAIIYE